MPLAAGVSQAGAGFLILLAAAVTAVVGVSLRAFVGRRADRHAIGRLTRRVRETALARRVFGPLHHDALDPDELDQTILMPTIVVSCGLCLTAVFLLGYRILT